MSAGKGIWVAPPEYVIIRKLEYYREGHSEKHLQDIAGMVKISENIIDKDFVIEWADRLNLREQWAQVLSAETL